MKLHLGCWKRKIPGTEWVHIDQADFAHIDYKTQVHDLHMIESNSCDLVYASHVLEYYDWQDAKSLVLPEWYRVLKTGSTLRLSVPNMEAIARLYMAGMKLDWFIGPMFGRMEIGPDKIYHKCIYDEYKLSELLTNTGFTNIRWYDWKKTEHADIDDHSKGYIPHMRDDGIMLSLNVEADKEGFSIERDEQDVTH